MRMLSAVIEHWSKQLTKFTLTALNCRADVSSNLLK